MTLFLLDFSPFYHEFVPLLYYHDGYFSFLYSVTGVVLRKTEQMWFWGVLRFIEGRKGGRESWMKVILNYFKDRFVYVKLVIHFWCAECFLSGYVFSRFGLKQESLRKNVTWLCRLFLKLKGQISSEKNRIRTHF